MSKYIDLADQIARDDLMERAPGVAYVMGTLEWLDSHPERVPGRTITESEFAAAVNDSFGGDYHYSAKKFVELIGITVVPDPDLEPTNAEKLADEMERAFGETGCMAPSEDFMRDLTSVLDRNGVKAPGGESDE